MTSRGPAYILLVILGTTIAGCQTISHSRTEGKHTCIVTPADLVECELAEDAETAWERRRSSQKA